MRGRWAVPVIFGILFLGFVVNQNAFSALFTDSFPVSGQESFPTGLAFSADGTKMFVVGTLSTDVNEYACGSAFDVSTCGFTDAFDISAQETTPDDVAFSIDGLTMFVVGEGSDNVNEYALEVAFDLFSSPPVGGTILPIDTTALLVAGAQTTTPWLILGVISAVGIGLAVFTLKRR